MNSKVSCVERSPLWLIVNLTHAINDTFRFGKPADYVYKRIDYEIRYTQYDMNLKHLFDFSAKKPIKTHRKPKFYSVFMKEYHPNFQ